MMSVRAVCVAVLFYGSVALAQGSKTSSDSFFAIDPTVLSGADSERSQTECAGQGHDACDDGVQDGEAVEVETGAGMCVHRTPKRFRCRNYDSCGRMLGNYEAHRSTDSKPFACGDSSNICVWKRLELGTEVDVPDQPGCSCPGDERVAGGSFRRYVVALYRNSCAGVLAKGRVYAGTVCSNNEGWMVFRCFVSRNNPERVQMNEFERVSGP